MFDLWWGEKRLKSRYINDFNKPLNSFEIKNILGKNNDLVIKNIYFNDKNIQIKVIGIDGMVESKIIDDYILKPIITNEKIQSKINENEIYKLINEGILYHFAQENINTFKDAIKSILQGDVLLIFDNINKAFSFDVKNIPKRGIQPSEDESVLKGAKDAFIENIRTNTALIRKKIKSPNLKFENYNIGKQTNTPVNVVYLDNIVDRKILNKVIENISNSNINNLISPGDFETVVKSNKYSIFPQILYTERVDKFCANLLDGKVGILIDGFPVAYIAPGLFNMFFQAPEDYSENYFISSIIRVLRYLCFLISLILPGFYVAITTFHHEMIPTSLLKSIIESKQGVPFTSLVEILLLLLAFELLLEASLRLPKTIGSTISIIGALIVGEAAVSAKFLSPAVVVIIAITGIAGFVIPNQDLSNATRICRLIMVFAAGVSGLFGISFVLLIILAYLCKLESFGIPYLIPFTSNEGENVLKDTLIRLPKDVVRK